MSSGEAGRRFVSTDLLADSVFILKPNTNVSCVIGSAGLDEDAAIEHRLCEWLPSLWSLRIMPATIGEEPAGLIRKLPHKPLRKLAG